MQQHFQSFIKLLREYVSIPSVSTDKVFADEINQQVAWLKQLFESNNFRVNIIESPNSNPVILAEYHVSGDLKTTMIYGHYDVQPAINQDGWKGHPFDLRECDGKLIGRGVVDNKGQNLIHIFTAITLIREGRLGCNLKFLIEGNEETGNPDLGNLIRENKDLLKCNRIIVSDGEIVGDTPTIEETLRGGANMTLKIISCDNDLHSGLYGGAVPNAARELAALATKMVSQNGGVNISGFYDGVNNIPAEKLASNKKILKISNPVREKVVKASFGRYDFHTTVGLRPSIEITTLSSGYLEPGYKNAIPGSATMKFNLRTVPSQNTEQVVQRIKDYITAKVPDYVKFEISAHGIYQPVVLDVTKPDFQEIMSLQEKIYGMRPIVKNVGGSIPAILDFQQVLGIDTILMSLGNHDCNMHGAEENFSIELIKKGLDLSEKIFGTK